MPSNEDLVAKIKGLEQELIQEKDKFKSIFFGSETPMVLYCGPEMVIEMCNDKYLEIYSNRNIIGKKFFEAIPELANSVFPSILKNVYETGVPYISREGVAKVFNLTTNIEEERYFDTHFSRISFGKNHDYRILATPREVTDRVQARFKIECNLFELEKERDLREKFVMALSHDLRTPLSIAKMYSEVLKSKVEDLNEDPLDIAVSTSKISSNLDRLDRMIRDLLDASKLSAGAGIPITLEYCKLEEIINLVINELKDIHGDRFRFENLGGDVTGYWDSMGLHRVIENLVINAIKYGSYDRHITITLDKNLTNVTLSVHNEGNPISESDQKQLFHQYIRLRSLDKNHHPGWGIGLTIVKGIVEAHKGCVEVKSNLEEGTRFTVTLPINLSRE